MGQRHCAQQCSDSKSVGIDTPQTSLAGAVGAGGGGGGAAAVGRHVKHSNCSLLHLTWHNSNRITCISLWEEREREEREMQIKMTAETVGHATRDTGTS